MTTDQGTFGGGSDVERLKTILAGWRTSLVDLSGRNRLLHFRHTRISTLEISAPSPSELVRLLENRALHFAPLPDEAAEEGEESGFPSPGENDIVTQKTTAPALQRAQRSLRSKATQMFNDYGLWTLHLGVGVLHWREDGAHVSSQAPLILFPVELVRTPTGQLLLRANDDEDPQLNPALTIKLEQFGINWTRVAETDCSDVSGVFEAVRKAVAGKSQWQVEERTVMALFASHKESMYRDLLENQDRLLESDLVRAVAVGPGDALASDRFDFEEVPAERVDELAAPEQTPLVLDADTSQRQAVAAAVAGRSFVLDGPPGTGKSQTITNIIAGLMHAGRSVLFVSEKAAALDVVLQRLKSVGLDSYALALHSRNTSRKAVAQELGRALSEQPQSSGLPDQERAQARLDRGALSAYATAMNEVRRPLGRSLHDVIGRVGLLDDAPVAYVATGDGTSRRFDASTLSAADLESVLEAARAVGGAWQAVADPAFPWRGLHTHLPHPGPALEEARTALSGLLGSLEGYEALNTDGAPFTTSAQVDRLTRLLRLLDGRPPVPEWWLTDGDVAHSVTDPVESFLHGLRGVRRAQRTAQDLMGDLWKELSPRLRAEAPATERALATLEPRGLELAELTERETDGLSQDFGKAADLLGNAAASARELTRILGIDEPGSLADATALCDLVDLSAVPHRPLEAWFAPEALASAQQAAVSLVAVAVEEFELRRDRTVAARASAREHAGPGWAEMPAHLPRQPEAAELALAALDPPGADTTALGRDEADALARRWGALAHMLEGTARCAADTARLLGVEPAGTLAGARSVTGLAALADHAHRAPEAWFDPTVLPRARRAVNELHRLMDALAEARREAQGVFRPETPRTAGLTDAVRRLSENGRRFAAGLSSQVRADRKLVGGVSAGGTWHGGLQEELTKAAAWQQAHQAVRAAVAEQRDLLAMYAGDELPDLDALDGALLQAETAHRLDAALVADPVRRRRMAAQLAHGSACDPALLAWGTRLEHDLSTWASALEEPRLREHEPALSQVGPAAAAAWLHAHTPALDDAVRLIDTVQTVGRREFPRSTGHTLSSARTAIAAAHAAQREDAAFAAGEAEDRELLCSWYEGLDTRLDPRPDSGGGAAVEDGLLHRAVRRRVTDGDTTLRSTATEATEASDPAALLGGYASDGRPRTAALAAALAAAAEAHRLAGPVLANPARRGGIVRALGFGQPAVPGLLGTGARLRSGCADWEAFTASPAVAPVGVGLRARSLHESAAWLRAHLDPLDEATSLIHSVTRATEPAEGGSTWMSLGDARTSVAAAVAARAAEEAFQKAEAQHRDLLGDLYEGIRTSRETVHNALDWALGARRCASGSGTAAPLAPEAAGLLMHAAPDSSVERRNHDWLERAEVLLGHFTAARAAVVRAELETAFPSALALLGRMADDPYGPDAWVRSAEGRTVLSGFGLGDLPAQLADRSVPASLFPAAVERTVLRAWTEHQLAVDSRLSLIRATDRDQLVERYRRLDRGLVQAAHATVIAACNTRRPRRATTGQAAILSRQAKLQRRHKPVRRLLDETRDVVQRLKPCFMMSPLTVSQFLPPDFHFDVVIFDEASQVLPQDAVNAVYRGDALIVAGDPRQLPPTSFFSAGGDADEGDEWDEEVPDSFESILDACKASGVLRELSLRWHYRSRHENLIAFSNHEFYDSSMVVFPGPVTSGEDVGVAFYKADGVYDRSNRRDNVREAEAVAERVIHHFSTRPHLTLGIVTLSKAQADAVEDAVAAARTDRPDLDPYFTEDRLGGFFVKNLETVQGDERDVIILSVGYGPDAQGKLRATFGPINREGGWRRLNVAVTRARHRVEVVASFHGADLADSTNKSVQHLKRYLQYAEQGPGALATAAPDADSAPESPFEEDVLDTLRGWGYDVQPQVGVAGFRIDMAVRHPGAPGSYALGIECDGAMYHSSRTARDRDRLREEILRGLGWNLHRIWGTDWYRNRKDAQRRLRTAVEAACAVDPHAPTARPEPVVADVPVPAEVEIVPVEESDRSEWSRPYRAMRPSELYELRRILGRQTGLGHVDLREPEAIDLVAELARHVISVEGPIEEEVLIGRVREAWGLDRAGQIVQASIRNALGRLGGKNLAVQAGTAWHMPEHPVTFARTPSADLDRKKVLHVPPAERQVALLGILSESPGLQRDELARETARFFGWLRLGADIRSAFDRDIEALIAGDSIEEGPSGLVPTEDRSASR